MLAELSTKTLNFFAIEGLFALNKESLFDGFSFALSPKADLHFLPSQEVLEHEFRIGTVDKIPIRKIADAIVDMNLFFII